MDPSTIGNIPPEILLEILRDLPIRSLKNARLASKQWADVGARCLFNRIYFTPRDEIMQVFTKITQNAAFVSNVETLVYDARLFWRHMENPEVYRAAQRRGFPDDFFDEDTPESETNASKVVFHRIVHTAANAWKPEGVKIDLPSEAAYLESATGYSDLLRQQTGIFDTQKDLDVLRAGLRRLANLKYIWVLDYFADHLDFIPFCWAVDEFRWYHDWSAALCKGIANPSSWYDADMKNEGISIHNAPWDFRGITNLLVAIEEHAPHLRHLSLGCQISRLSAEIYGREENARPLCKIAPRLTSLKIDCDMPHPPDLLSDRHFKTMQDIVKNMHHLRSLSLTIPRTSDDFYEVFWDAKWSHLTILELGDGAWYSEEIEELVSSHADTLRELRLRNIEFIEGDPWEVVAKRLGQALQLRMVCLMNLADDSRLPSKKEVSDKRMERSARLFMKRTPDHLLGLKVEYGTAIAWQKQNFKPAYDFDRILNNIPD